MPVPPEWTGIAYIEEYMKAAGGAGQLPIPSQKHGICANDSLQSVFFFADELREFFWQSLILGFSELRTDCHYKFPSLPLAPQGTPARTQQEKLILMCWLGISATRVAGMIRKHMADRNFVRRLPSEPLGQITPVGDTCGQGALLYSGVPPGVKKGKRSYGLALEYQDALFKGIAARVNPVLGFVVKQHNELVQGDNVVAITFITVAEGGTHEVAFVKILGTWRFCDSNIGLALPIDPQIMQRVSTHYISHTYGNGRVNGGLNDELAVSTRPNDGDNQFQGVNQELSTFKSHLNPNNVPWYEDDVSYRRYFIATPGSGKASAGGALSQELRAEWQALMQDSITNPYRVSTGVRGYGGRRRLTSRPSSLPKRKGLSSARSQGYTRRQRASRSGTGGYRAKGTGRKV